MNTAAIIILVLDLLWYLSALACTYIWFHNVGLRIGFWAGILMYTPIVNTIFMIILAIKFTPKGFFDICELTKVFKKKDGVKKYGTKY